MFTSDTYINPAETGFYYLGSRYYDPEVGRFINADTTDVLTINPTSVDEKNLYSYCNNNPVNYQDSNGYFALPAVGWIAIDEVTNVFISYSCARLLGQEFTAEDWAITATTALIGSLGKKVAVIGAVLSGCVAMADSYAGGNDMKTALLVGGITIVMSYSTMNTFIELIGYDDISNAAKLVNTVTFGTGNTIVTTAVGNIGKSKNIKTAAPPLATTVTSMNNEKYLKTKNGKLMR